MKNPNIYFAKSLFSYIGAPDEVYEKITFLEAWSIVEAILSWKHKMPSVYSIDVVKDLRRKLQVADRQIYNRRNKLAEMHEKYGFIKKPGSSKTLEWDFLQFFFNGQNLIQLEMKSFSMQLLSLCRFNRFCF